MRFEARVVILPGPPAPFRRSLAASRNWCTVTVIYAYYAERGLVPAGSGGWQEDNISTGKTTLTRQPNGDLDILFADATNGVYSSRAEGAVVILQRKTDAELTVLVDYPGATAEVYTFLKNPGSGQLIMSQSKGNQQITKSGVYVSECQVLAPF